ncbi:hypothetical protein ACFY3G_49920 [Streptomyces phaeochromogenes]|uniref:hypothetical protein n=1 Tax=Streptomyces phaeochromogenes TaxID=1923 RepID=UPI003676327E
MHVAVDDPALRARTITRILRAVEDDPRLKQAREADVRELRQTRTGKKVSGARPRRACVTYRLSG